MSPKYYCTKCQHNHFLSSKIGKKHLKYKKSNQNISNVNQNKIEPNNEDTPKQASVSKIIGEVGLEHSNIEQIINENNIKKRSSNRIVMFIRNYQKSYRKGIEMYGVWWKVFQLSIWSIILIFLLTASIIFIIFLPKIDFINWILR